MPVNKVVKSFDEAVADVFDGATILVGGFISVGGVPSNLLRALAKRPVKNLTIVGNSPVLGKEFQQTAARTMKVPDWWEDASILLLNGQVSKLIVSGVSVRTLGLGRRFPIFAALEEGQNIEIEMVAQGTLAERIRAGRAGIPAFYSPIGVGIFLQRGKETRFFGDHEYLLEYAIKGDFAFIWAYKADRYGNLVYKGTSRTFNATMAGAARVTIAEVEELVEVGDLDPETIVTPSLYVDRVVVKPYTGRTLAMGGQNEC